MNGSTSIYGNQVLANTGSVLDNEWNMKQQNSFWINFSEAGIETNHLSKKCNQRNPLNQQLLVGKG